MNAFLEILIEGAPARRVPLGEGVFVIGREKACDICIDDKTVSRKHAKLSYRDGVHTLEDLGSGNGTMVNGKKITSKKLKNGDSVTIGAIAVSYSCETVKEASGVSSSLSQPAATHNMMANKAVLTVLIAATLLLGSLSYVFVFNKGAAGAGKEKMVSRYTIVERDCSFMHPRGWERVEKFFEDVIKITYFDHFCLFFGQPDSNDGAMFAVDVVTHIPPSMRLMDLILFDSEKVPRVMNHGPEVADYKDAVIDDKKAVIIESKEFEKGGNMMRSMEAFILVGNRRYLLIGFAPSNVYDSYRDIFHGMIASFTTTYSSIAPSGTREQALQQSQEIMNKAAVFVEKRDLEAKNLYLGVSAYIKAITLLNAFYPLDSEPVQSCLSKLKDAQGMFETTYKRYRFNMDRALKLGDPEQVYNAAKNILAIIPDKTDERYKDAQWYYDQYKEIFEKKGLQNY